MSDKVSIIVPLAMVGAGLFLFGGGSRPESQAPAVVPPPPFGARLPVHMGRGIEYTYVDPHEVVLVHSDRPSAGHPVTLIRSRKPDGSLVTIYVALKSRETLDILGSGSFLLFHRPTGSILWENDEDDGEIEDNPSMEVTPVWVNPSFVEMFGPSSVLHFGRRVLGKIYLWDGSEIELHESISTVRDMLPNVKEIRLPHRPKKRDF